MSGWPSTLVEVWLKRHPSASECFRCWVFPGSQPSEGSGQPGVYHAAHKKPPWLVGHRSLGPCRTGPPLLGSLGLSLALRSSAGVVAMTASMIMINLSAPAGQIGAVNGAGVLRAAGALLVLMVRGLSPLQQATACVPVRCTVR